jgi:hypothetical protein
MQYGMITVAAAIAAPAACCGALSEYMTAMTS